MSETFLYHYTTFDTFKRMLKQGEIKPDRSEPENQNEIPTVTFSSHPEWEPTRYRVGKLPNGQMIMMNRLLLEKFCGGIVRIVVKSETAPMSWYEMKDEVGLSQSVKKGLYDFALHVGARTSHWFGTFKSVPESDWVNVQIFKGDQWTDLAPEEIPSLDDVDLDVPQPSVVEIKFDSLENKISNEEPVLDVTAQV